MKSASKTERVLKDLETSFLADMTAAMSPATMGKKGATPGASLLSNLGQAFGATAKFIRRLDRFRATEADARVSALEGRLAHLEDQLGSGAPLKYAGVWQRALSYRPGGVVTHQGSAWVLIKDVKAGVQPGDGDAWQLMVKRGRDAK